MGNINSEKMHLHIKLFVLVCDNYLKRKTPYCKQSRHENEAFVNKSVFYINLTEIFGNSKLGIKEYDQKIYKRKFSFSFDSNLNR